MSDGRGQENRRVEFLHLSGHRVKVYCVVLN